VLANYNQDDEKDNDKASSLARLRGKFNLTNTGSRTVRRGNWELYVPSFPAMQFNDNGTILGKSGLKVGTDAGGIGLLLCYVYRSRGTEG